MVGTEFTIKNIISKIIFGSMICESLEDRLFVNYIFNVLNEGQYLDGEPISIEELRNLLRKQIINFKFIKLNGEIRPARGTTNLKFIPQRDHPKGVRSPSSKVATFYDLSKDAWRSVSNRSKEIALQIDSKTHEKKVIISDKTPKIEPSENNPINKPKETLPNQEIYKDKELSKSSQDYTSPEYLNQPPLNIDDSTVQASSIQDDQIIAPEENENSNYLDDEENEENENTQY